MQEGKNYLELIDDIKNAASISKKFLSKTGDSVRNLSMFQKMIEGISETCKDILDHTYRLNDVTTAKRDQKAEQAHFNTR